MMERIVALKQQLLFLTRGNTTGAMTFLNLCGLNQKNPPELFTMEFFSVLLDSITSSTRYRLVNLLLFAFLFAVAVN